MADGAPSLAGWPSPCLGVDEVHVWRIPLDHERDPASDRRGAIARAAQTRSQARAGLLRILAHYAGMPADTLSFDVDALGKPCLRNAGAPSYNLSHTRGLALVAVSAGAAVGVDVEHLRPLADADALAQRFLSPAESAAVLEVAPAGRGAAFLRTWTRKEAVLKASGHGLALDTRDIEVGSGPADRFVAIDHDAGTRRYRVVSLSVDPGWAAALAVATETIAPGVPPPRVHCFELAAAAAASSCGSTA